MSSGHPDTSKPLKPLSNHAWSWLKALVRGPVPRYQINAGVTDRFYREALADEVIIAGTTHVQITAAGIAKVEGGIQ